MPKNKNWMIAAVAVFLCVSGCLYSMWYQKEDISYMPYHEESSFSPGDQPISEDEGESTALGGKEAEKDAVETKKDIIVYICGEVKMPGVYSLAEGSRVSDVLELCGGYTKQAADTFLNLAEKAEDGQKIYVPSQKESKEKKEENAKQMSGEEYEKNSSPGSQKGSSESLVNINTAGKEELMMLPGIGESKAESIMAYRNEHGAFSKIEELMEIRGIKSGVFEKIKARIRV